jgi:hypothetical protein
VKTQRQKQQSTTNSSKLPPTGRKPAAIKAVEVPVVDLRDQQPSGSEDLVFLTAGWLIKAQLEDYEERKVDEHIPQFESLIYNPNVKVMRYSVTGDFYRLFANPSFWTAALTQGQREIDREARKVVPSIPLWSRKTWCKVADLEPTKKYAVADWIANNCRRAPKAELQGRLAELKILVTAWIEFDSKAAWFDPEIASSDTLKRFLKAALSYIRLDPKANLLAHLTKRVKPAGKPPTLQRTKRVIVGAHFWKNNGKPSIHVLEDKLEKSFRWKINEKDGKSDSFEKIARDAKNLGLAETTVAES